MMILACPGPPPFILLSLLAIPLLSVVFGFVGIAAVVARRRRRSIAFGTASLLLGGWLVPLAAMAHAPLALTLLLSGGPVVGAVSIGAGAHLPRRVPEGLCRCGYNLFGNVSGICPECGTPIRKARQ